MREARRLRRCALGPVAAVEPDTATRARQAAAHGTPTGGAAPAPPALGSAALVTTPTHVGAMPARPASTVPPRHRPHLSVVPPPAGPITAARVAANISHCRWESR